MNHRLILRIMELQWLGRKAFFPSGNIPLDVILSLEKKTPSKEHEGGHSWNVVMCQSLHYEDSRKFSELKHLITDVIFDKNLAFLNVKNENKEIQKLCKNRLMINEETIPYDVLEVSDANCLSYNKEVSGYTYISK